MSTTLDDTEKGIFVRALIDDVQADVDELVHDRLEKLDNDAKERMSRMDETNDRYAQSLAKTLGAVDKQLLDAKAAQADLEKTKYELEKRLLAVELAPKKVEIIQPLAISDMKPVAEAIGGAMDRMTYEMKSLPRVPDIIFDAKPLAEMVGSLLEVIEDQKKERIAERKEVAEERKETTALLAKLLKALADKKPDTINVEESASMKKAIGTLADLVDTLANKLGEKPAAKGKRKIKIVHGEKESTITEE